MLLLFIMYHIISYILLHLLVLVCSILQLGSLLSMYGCYQHHKKSSGDKVDNVDVDAEQGMHDDAHALPQSSNASDQEKNLGAPQEVLVVRQHAGTWGYIFQIIFQVHSSIFIYHWLNCKDDFFLWILQTQEFISVMSSIHNTFCISAFPAWWYTLLHVSFISVLCLL